MKNFCVQFCGAIKALRDRAGKGQIAFARELGLSQPVYARYEKGDREPTLNELIRIAHVLNTTPNVLLGFEAPPPLRASAPPHETKIRTGDNSPVVIGGVSVVGNHNNVTPPNHHHHQPLGGRGRRNEVHGRLACAITQMTRNTPKNLDIPLAICKPLATPLQGACNRYENRV